MLSVNSLKKLKLYCEKTKNVTALKLIALVDLTFLRSISFCLEPIFLRNLTKSGFKPQIYPQNKPKMQNIPTLGTCYTMPVIVLGHFFGRIGKILS